MTCQRQSWRRSFVALAGLVVGLAAGLIALTAQANHIPGATYSGTTSAGGTISFTVSANGSGINTVSITDPGSTCAFSSLTKYYSNSSAGPLPIVNHAFSDPDPGFRLQGSFSGRQRAQGSFGGNQCVASLSWSATTASPPPSAPQTNITRHPAKLQIASTLRVQARFAFRSSSPGSTFECSLDRGPWRACRSPKTYRVGVGTHSFRVRAGDAAGAVDPTPAIWRWKVVRRGAPSPPARAWTACPGTFQVLHRDHIGPLRVRRGSHRISVLESRAARAPSKECRLGAFLLAWSLLEDYDGVLHPVWRANFATATFTLLLGREAGFALRLKRLGPLDGDVGGPGSGLHPHYGRFCAGTFRVRRDDQIGNMPVPAGSYWIALLQDRGLSCLRASALFARFLSSESGRLPPPWTLDPGTGKFRPRERGERPGPGFRVKPTR